MDTDHVIGIRPEAFKTPHSIDWAPTSCDLNVCDYHIWPKLKYDAEHAKRRNEITNLRELKFFLRTWDERYCVTSELDRAILGERQPDGSFFGGLPSRLKAIIEIQGRPLGTLSRSERKQLGTVDFRDIIPNYEDFVLELPGPSFSTF